MSNENGFPVRLDTSTWLDERFAFDHWGDHPFGMWTTMSCTERSFGQLILTDSAAIATFVRKPKHIHTNVVFHIRLLLWFVSNNGLTQASNERTMTYIEKGRYPLGGISEYIDVTA